MPEETTRLHRELIRIETDQSTANETEQTTERIRAASERMRASFRAIGRELGTTDDRLARFGPAAEQFGARIDRDAAALKNLERAARGAGNEVDHLGRTQQQQAEQARLYGDVESRTRAITGAVGYIGGGQIERTANIGAELLAVNEAFGLLNQELPELISGLELTRVKVLALGAAGLALAGLGLAYRAYIDRKKEEKEALEASRKALQEYLAKQQELVVFLNQASSQDIRDRIENEKKGRSDALAIAREANKRLLEIQTEIFTNIGQDIPDHILSRDEWAEALGVTFLTDAFQPYREEIDQLNTIIEEQTAAVGEYNTKLRVLNDALLPTGDRLTTVGTALNDALETFIGHAGVIAQVTMPALNEQFEKLQNAAGTGGRSPLDNIFFALGSAYNTVAPAIGELNERQQQLAAVEKARAELTDKLTDLTEKYNLTQRREAEDFDRQRARDLADHYGDLADLDTKYFKDREGILSDLASETAGIASDKIKLARDQNRELEQLAQDHRDRMYQIERDSRRDPLTAARRLDGIRWYDAKQAQKDAIEDENRQYEKEKDRREEDFRDRLRELDDQRYERQRAGREALRDLEDQHRAERASKELDFRLRLAREDEDRAVRLQRQAQDFQAQRAALLQHYADEIGLTAQHWQTMYTTTQIGMQWVQSAAIQGFQAIAGALTSQTTAGSFGTSVTGAVGSAVGGVQSAIENAARQALLNALNGVG